MAERNHRPLAVVAAGAITLASFPLAATAQTGTYYTPPKLVRQATPSTPIAGTGAVTVQVFVKKSGQIGTVKVEKSTNHADDAAALEIARNSTYKPGMRDAKPVDAFYTMALKFSGTNVVNDTGTSSGQLVAANGLIHAGKYTDAKTQLQSYLTAHPGDKDANALLGVADAFLKDDAGAAAAFDAAGTVPDRFKNVAAGAYSDAAIDALKVKRYDDAIALANKTLGLEPQNLNALYVQGAAYANSQRYPEAIGALEKAKSLAATHSDAATMNLIDASLANAYVLGGRPDQGIALARQLKQRDPSNTSVDNALANYYNGQATAAMKAGKTDEAVADLENAAQTVPSRAAVLYVAAANVLSNAKPVDWKRVKAEADKALAIDGNEPHANFVAGVALANGGDQKGAMPYLQKAKANVGSDTQLSADIDAALKKLGPK